MGLRDAADIAEIVRAAIAAGDDRVNRGCSSATIGPAALMSRAGLSSSIWQTAR